jgi:hypothetical protein
VIGGISLAVGLLAAAVSACSRREPAVHRDPDQERRARAVHAQTQQQRALEQAERTRQVATAEVKTAARELMATPNFYRNFRARVDAARRHGVTTELAQYSQAIVAFEGAIDAKVRELDSLRSPPALPDVPEKPRFEKPEYSGAWLLQGRYVGRFEDRGIVVKRGGKYFVVEGGERPTTSFVYGYVKTVGMHILNIGDGREADGVTITDREEYVEDQKKYREEVAEARKEYEDKLRQYSAAVATRAAAERTAGVQLTAYRVRRENLQRELDVLLGQFVAAVRGDGPGVPRGVASALGSRPAAGPSTGETQRRATVPEPVKLARRPRPPRTAGPTAAGAAPAPRSAAGAAQRAAPRDGQGNEAVPASVRRERSPAAGPKGTPAPSRGQLDTNPW